MARRAAVNSGLGWNALFAVFVVLGLAGASLFSFSFATTPSDRIVSSPGARLGAATSTGSAALAAARASLAAHTMPAAGPANGTGNWSLILPASNGSAALPAARQLQAMAYDPADGYVVMFGGGNVNPGTQQGDTWTFSNGSWTNLNLSVNPEPRRSASLVWDAADGYLVLFGGLYPGDYLSTSAQYQDTWSFVHGAGTNRTAAMINGTNTPSARWNAQMAYDPGRSATILFGGCTSLACASSLNDTWSYAGGSWTNVTANVGGAPPVRGTATMLWYPPDSALFLFGGSTPAQTVYGDTWELGAAGWGSLSPPTSPSARGDAWVIYDNSTSQVVLFGGFSYTLSPSGVAVNDTWTYANGTWTNQTLTHPVAPSPRWGMEAAGAYDTATGCGYLFGGADTNDVNLGDTWVYNCPSLVSSGPGGGGPPPSLELNVTPGGSSSPLTFRANATLAPLAAPGNFSLQLAAEPVGNSSPVWTFLATTWDGSTLSVNGTLPAAGAYEVTGIADTEVAGVWTVLSTVQVSLTVVAGGGSAPTVSLAVSPSGGPAPLEVSIAVAANGGAAPYNLSLCLVLPTANTSACASSTMLTGWDGSTYLAALSINTSGNSTVFVSVVDTLGASTNASAAISVGAPVVAAPLIVGVGVTAPAVTTSLGATYEFLTRVSGGAAPLTIQWAFGDGTSGSGMANAVTPHTYIASGTFHPSLLVTDALGHRATALVDPIVVALAPEPSAAAPVSPPSAVVALAVGISVAAVIVIGATVGQLLRRREALNWLRDLRERRTDDPSRSGSE